MGEPFIRNERKIAVIGGGTGSFTLLSALKEHTSQIAAIVNMVDDGGSTGVLRDELGVLPPGDVRQCLVALSDSPKLRELFNYRFDDGTFNGHSFGNIFLTALEKTTGSFAEAVETAGEVLGIHGTVIPATLDNIRMEMSWPDGTTLKGQHVINSTVFNHDPREATITLSPKPIANTIAVEAIKQADMVVIAPGGLYTSLGPLLEIKGIGDALRSTSAQVIYVCNLVAQSKHERGFTVSDFANEIQRMGGGGFLDAVLYNSQIPSKRIQNRYAKEGSRIVEVDIEMLRDAPYHAVGGNFLGQIVEYNPAAIHLPVQRSLIRHDAIATAGALIALYDANSERRE